MLHQYCDRLLWALQGGYPQFSGRAGCPADPANCGEPLTVATLQLRRPQLFAVLKIATCDRFDNNINVVMARKCVAAQGYREI